MLITASVPALFHSCPYYTLSQELPFLSTPVHHREKKQASKVSEGNESNKPTEKTLQVSLWLRVENNSKFVRGKTKVRQRIEETILSRYNMQKEREDGWDYTLTIW